MKPANYIRLFFLASLLLLCMAFYSRSRLKFAGNGDGLNNEKCELKKSAPGFLIQESLSLSFMGNNP